MFSKTKCLCCMSTGLIHFSQSNVCQVSYFVHVDLFYLLQCLFLVCKTPLSSIVFIFNKYRLLSSIFNIKYLSRLFKFDMFLYDVLTMLLELTFPNLLNGFFDIIYHNSLIIPLHLYIESN
jgi:hypothetical protein